MRNPIGSNGARVLRRIEVNGEVLVPGTVLTPEQVLEWPLRNRIALESTKRVEFYTAPVTALQAIPTIDEDLDPDMGQFGGVTLEVLTTGGVEYPPGTRIPAEVVMGWPIKNRAALQNSGRVAYFREAPSAEKVKAFRVKDKEQAESLLA